tara:strand:- start:1084 stop:1509 length:426 start_codon:yes stop_codon:yes gene_type:complete
MKQLDQSEKPLTKNQALVFDALTGTEEPLSAYTILDRLRDEGLRAPLQIYRALDKLMDLGMVHRLESLNAFVACSHPACGAHETVAFAICDGCGQVDEVADERLASHLTAVAQHDGFTLKQSIVELRGLCRTCAARSSAPQ